MKDAEDEAFDELARRQGSWGGGYQAKRAMAAAKLVEDQINYGTSWSKNGERIDPASVYLEVPAHGPMPTVEIEYTLSVAEPAQDPWNEDEWRRNNWRCQHGWLRGEQCEICNAPKREWVGLTENTVLNMMPNTIPSKYDGQLMEFAKALEQTLKEKNNG